jgi:ribonuclease HIII
VIPGTGPPRQPPITAAGARTVTAAHAGAAIGIDESGKGDYFGPLVVAGVYVDAAMGTMLLEAGVRDSKTLSDTRIAELARLVASRCPSSVVAIGPERYNALYASIANLNRLLAWGHARVLENLLGRVECTLAIADQFGDERFLREALMHKGRAITLIQQPRAEVHPAVAAASVLARAEFVRRLATLGSRFGFALPKGAGPPVLAAGRSFVGRHGPDALGKVAKLHFKTTRQILRNDGTERPAR